jgi:hypothetical protein
MEHKTINTSEAQLRLQQLVDYLRGNVRQLDDPRAQALYETSAEVLLGLKKAFMDYSKQSESAWR